MSLLSNHDHDHEMAVPASGEARTGRRYWRSLDELSDTPQFREFLEREFPSHASEMISPFTRRAFLNLMGASVALAGALTGCRRPEQRILPYARRPEDLVPGVPQRYATSVERGGNAIGILATCFEGRPVKLEGHPQHPVSQGALDMIGQALVLELYDPDRSIRPLEKGLPVAPVAEVIKRQAAALAARLRAADGEGVAFLSGLATSPLLASQRGRLLERFPRASWHVWEPLNEDHVYAGTSSVLGRPLRPAVDFSRADLVLALDADFLGRGVGALADTRAFSARRRTEDSQSLNRLYAVEGAMTLTGMMADHRLRLAPSQVEAFTLALAAELASEHGLWAGQAPAGVLAIHRAHRFDARWIAALARDLMAHRGRCAIMVGQGQPASLHALAAALNVELAGPCVQYRPPVDASHVGAGDSLAALVESMRAGRVRELVILGGNPVFDAPADLDFSGALAGIEASFHLGLEVNETALACDFHLPEAHPLESWGDTRAADGTIALQQPLIEPLYGGTTAAELISMVIDDTPRSGYELLRAHYRGAREEAAFEPDWAEWLREGIIPESAFEPEAVQVDPAAVAAAITGVSSPAPPSRTKLELVFLPSKIHDGRHANNGWLQEVPDPVTKLAWDNAALVSPETARALGLDNERVVRLSAGEVMVELPVWIQPGMADWVVAAPLGYGRREVGRIGNQVGTDLYPLRRSDTPLFRSGVALSVGRDSRPLACTQDHWSMEDRDLVREASAEDYQKDPHLFEHMGGHIPEHGPLWQPPLDYAERPQWGMAIDLSTCTGCQACVVACQAENNIPIVGSEQVRNGREMHWLRVDRYYVGEPESPQAVVQPMPCQHCETAPCEQVCPVAATTHSPDGMNEMTYNRCIGTRYCANNCPFKVRRFNFFDYTSEASDIEKMRHRPDVTVRMRGVMEKCSFCIQRISRAGIAARKQGRPIAEGEMVTACQQGCPADAIVFGDLLDPESRVRQLKQWPRHYGLLASRNLRPRVTYLGRLRNPNPELVS